METVEQKKAEGEVKEKPLKVNLGSGNVPIDGYLNLDRKNGHEAFPLNMEDDKLDELRASHLLEHFPIRQALEVLINWAGKLKPGTGVMKIAVPDFKIVADRYLKGGQLNVGGYLMGGQVDEDDYHKALYDECNLTRLMQAAGLENIRRWESEVEDCASMDISLNLMGNRINGKMPVAAKTKIVALMSLPRLIFSDNMFSCTKAFYPLGIQLERGTGVYWPQVMERLMESHMDDGTELIISVDYDTWFTKEHVQKLCQLMVEHPEADAIIPMQVKRENDATMFGLVDDEGTPKTIVDLNDFRKPIVKVLTGHFGLTIFRPSALKKMPHPWFIGKPNSQGRWGKGRLDDDINFWHNFKDAGNQAYLSTEVKIGHLQLVCTFPGKLEDELKPIQYYMNEVESGNIQRGLVPEVTLLK